MKVSPYQTPELRNESDAVIQVGTYGKYTPFANADNTGILDYINNNLEALKNALSGAYVYVKNKSSLPASGDVTKIYVTQDDGKSYKWTGTEWSLLTSQLNGLSAYEMAQTLGFTGTEEEWIMSIRGEKGEKGDSITGATVDSDGYLILTLSTGTTIKTTLKPLVDAKQYADNAAASATQAGESEANAATSLSQSEASASQASSSASDAASSASKAKQSETNAANSESNALQYKNAANDSKTAAATSATNAAESAESAEQSATNAAESAESAKDSYNKTASIQSDFQAVLDTAKASETAAKVSETNAKTSETNATASASTATAQANTATTQANNAKTSATNSANSASASATSAGNAKTSETNAGASATTAKNWAVSETSPDGATDTDSTTGKTQSSRTWALESKASAQSASSSASTATTQASSASTSAANASKSATAASGSATNAASSATSASASASSAASSAASASDSKDKASEYKTSASGSATAAASSASSASASATNAKAAMNTANTAASSASTSATSASTSASNASKSEIAAKAAQAEAEKARDDANSAVTKLTGVMKYAGQVDDYSDLSDKTKNKGDVWNVVNADDAHGVKAGDNVVWNGTDWDNLSGYVDLSAFAQKDDYQKVITSATANGATITFNHKDGTTSTATVNNVATATVATNDAKGQKIDATYEKIADASNVHTSLQNSINTKQDKLTFDKVPTAGSTNPVTSDGVKRALDNKPDKTGEGASGTWGINITGNAKTATKATQDASGNVITTTYAKKSEIPSVPVKGVKISGSTSNLTPDTSGIVTIPAIPTKVSTFTNDSGYLTTHQDLSGYQTKLTFDSTPTANSSNPVTSAGIKAAIDAKTVDLSNYYTKTQVDSAISAAISAIVDGDSNSY